MMSDGEMKAYIAGLIDGEGSICITRKGLLNRVQYLAMISIQMCDREGIDFVASRYGGKVYLYQPPGENRQVTYSWKLSKNPVVKQLLYDILPYLMIKRTQAILLLEYVNKFSHGVGNHPYSEKETIERDLYRKICGGLNSRGTEATALKTRLKLVL